MEQQTTFIPDGMNAFERNVKRIGDCIIAGILLIIFSPLFLICYIAVKREDGGPAIFKQERIGRFGRPFYIYKFRSMRLDAEKMGPALYRGGKDKRLTKVGKFCVNIIWMNCRNFGMSSAGRWLLLVHVRSVSISLIK